MLDHFRFNAPVSCDNATIRTFWIAAIRRIVSIGNVIGFSAAARILVLNNNHTRTLKFANARIARIHIKPIVVRKRLAVPLHCTYKSVFACLVKAKYRSALVRIFAITKVAYFVCVHLEARRIQRILVSCMAGNRTCSPFARFAIGLCFMACALVREPLRNMRVVV